MYEQVFGLKKRPFTSTPFVQNYYPGDSIHHALSQIRLTIERAAGPTIVTGAAGTGKSLLLAMLKEYFQHSCQVASLMCANVVERRDILQSILFELGLPYRDMTEGELRLSLIDSLKSTISHSGSLLLLVDEAHSLSAEILDELRVITNISSEGNPAVALVLAGLPSLEDHLIETKSESLNQRIAARCYLTNLSRNETFEYVVTHLERVGGNGENIFTSDGLSAIHEYSDGCPRIINQICDYSLVLAASQSSERVTAGIVSDAWNDVQSIPGSPVQSEFSNPQSDDELHILEFGSLDSADDESDSMADEPESDLIESNAVSYSLMEDFVADEVVEETIEADQFVDEFVDVAEVVEESTIEKDFEYRLQSVDESDQISGGEKSMESFDYSIVDDNDQEELPGFANPFEEEFVEEETVYAAHIPAVSEQNLNALMITSEQLCLLEKLQLSENVNTETATSEDSPDLDGDDATEDKTGLADDTQDLHLTAEAIKGLEQVEQDVRRLQRDLMFTQQQFSSQAVHPDFEYAAEQVELPDLTDEKPVDSTSESIVEEAVEKLSTIQFEYAMIDSTEDVVDDRDMMIISQSERLDAGLGLDKEEPFDEGSYISTGNAERMDYHELFKQLRSAT